MESLPDDIRCDIWWRVQAGYQSREEIIAAVVVGWQHDQTSEHLEALVGQTTDQLLAEHFREQSTWPEVTDCDRLNAAFAKLDASGILARQNYGQTLTSGGAAIWAEIEHERTKRPIRGFVFFHEQDTEVAVRCDGPALAWGKLPRAT